MSEPHQELVLKTQFCRARATVRLCLVFVIWVFLVLQDPEYSIADSQTSKNEEKKSQTIEFDDATHPVAPMKIMAPLVSPYDNVVTGKRKDFLILSAKGKEILVSVPNAMQEMKKGDVLVMVDENGAKQAKFKVVRLSKDRVKAVLTSSISSKVRKSLMGSAVRLEKAETDEN